MVNTARNLIRSSTPPAVIAAYHFLLAAASALRYGFPSRSLIVIGVTGTDGKTTVVHLLHDMLAAAGYGVGSVSSLRFKINDEEEPNLLKMTMPGRFRLQKFLADCRRKKCRVAVIEVTSQGILQSRHRFIRFHAGVLTNVTPEHIESHGGFERYRDSKMELFRRLPATGWAILNREDPSAELFAGAAPADTGWYSRNEIKVKGVGHTVHSLAIGPRNIAFEIDGRLIETRLGGAFNFLNALAASAAAMAMGASLPTIALALGRANAIPGRLEYIQERPFFVVVDYAVTPKALESVYAALGPDLICVFGSAGGGRDRWKRPKLGAIAGASCKSIVLTSDDPDEEDPAAIAEEIRAGVPENRRGAVRVVVDRRAAIRAGLALARPGDTVIITGMGAQPWLIVDGKKIPWDDREVIREELGGLNG